MPKRYKFVIELTDMLPYPRAEKRAKVDLEAALDVEDLAFGGYENVQIKSGRRVIAAERRKAVYDSWAGSRALAEH